MYEILQDKKISKKIWLLVEEWAKMRVKKGENLKGAQYHTPKSLKTRQTTHWVNDQKSKDLTDEI